MSAEESKRVIERMVDALNRHVIAGQEEFWAPDAVWRGPAGAGVKPSLEAFQSGWQRHFLKAFPDKETHDEIRIAEGDFVAASGRVCATHQGEFMGLPGNGQRVTLRYMDFWRIENGKIAENWVLLDIIDFFRQHGIDLLNGKGWDQRR